MILDKTGCHPFDENRAGLTLGEGAAFLVLESEEVVQKEQKTILAEVSGYGNANDAYHQTASSPEGTGAFMAMSQALAMSGLSPDKIDYINVHGTGTQNNDLSEGIAMERLFADQVPPFSSTKGYTGHTLGAAGAVEAVISILTIQHQVIFPNLHFSTPMKELHIRPVTSIETFHETSSSREIINVLSNSFGFGGNNSAIVLSNPKSQIPNPKSQISNFQFPISNIFINGLGNVSPQKTTDNSRFLEEPISFDTNQLKCIDPGYKEFIPAEMIRRMGRIIKMGVAASKLCLKDAGSGHAPDAIITGTGLGCVEDTEKFLASMINNNEEFLTPTSFIQSTHNTVAGQIALLLKCHGYNFTYVHRGISFETALGDAMTQMQMGGFAHVLVGGSDELTANSHTITSRLGFWKPKPVHSFNLLNDKQHGTIAGEGASFMFLETQKNEHTYAQLTGVTTFLKPASKLEVQKRLHDFLATFGLTTGDIGLVILGLNGDPCGDQAYHDLVETEFQQTSLAYFKHLCGEYHTASAFGAWLGAMILKTQSVPEVVRVNNPLKQPKLEHVLIYNHFRENNQVFILLSRP
jgi:3-oxoacyl-(acyl-carrier-protein) synthase